MMDRPADELTIDDAVQVLDHMVRRAVALRASDIHLEPKRRELRVRFRIDGVMADQGILPALLAPPLLTRVKVLGRMDMTERRLPQDGQFTLELPGDQIVHLRASTFPAIHGETLVLRVLLGHQLIPLDKLGLSAAQLATVERLIDRPSGLVLVCGPTGSGKTSTLYSILQRLDTEDISVVTLEDPIEVEFAHVTQGQANVRQGFTFAAGLRAILRQDPDVILVGEMRDPETSQIALQASLTGHQVFSTLHTADAVETMTRLVDLGAEPWIVANALLAVVAQRLVRVLCPHCAESHSLLNDMTAGPGDERVLLKAGTTIKRAKGCPRCHDTGHAGRTGIFEVLELDDELRDMVKSRTATRDYRAYARRMGVRGLREAGLELVGRGVTSLEEVLRVT
jgi:type II secretory ATPase GspE/PulE/Tfp pilus assembly ATPase PilB-like protein